MNFYALRVSLVAAEPQLFIHQNMSKDIYAFENALSYAVNNPPENESGEILYSIKILIEGKDSGVMGGMVAKAKSINGHDLEFNEYSVDDYPPMVWLWDREQQVILLEKKTSVFSTPTAACKAFMSISNNIELAEIGLRVDIEPVLNEENQNFWEEYDKFDYVEAVTFELIPPNLFGNTEKEMKKALLDTAEGTNANKITTVFENKDSKLNLKSDGFLNNMIRWCRKGGGNWLLKGRLSGHRKQISQIKSEKTAKIVVMEGKGITELQLRNYGVEDIVQIVELYRPQYDYNEKIDG
ncbi:hypothetical protein VCSRO96_3013 [Vibrio cholerae]|uniref:hypothetical protein n=2 Tax=Vibrio TaxID=662 RepID=UPI001DB0CAA0|nr:hypothetical protein [Vibrio cholerae]BCK33193.1 hypothetical protein VCSRO96_3013 [Vibrio cholerae]CAB1261763.1 Uncharacterised protein [Vibrio cholerae]